jgi:hypothetical protein
MVKQQRVKTHRYRTKRARVKPARESGAHILYRKKLQSVGVYCYHIPCISVCDVQYHDGEKGLDDGDSWQIVKIGCTSRQPMDVRVRAEACAMKREWQKGLCQPCLRPSTARSKSKSKSETSTNTHMIWLHTSNPTESESDERRIHATHGIPLGSFNGSVEERSTLKATTTTTSSAKRESDRLTAKELEAWLQGKATENIKGSTVGVSELFLVPKSVCLARNDEFCGSAGSYDPRQDTRINSFPWPSQVNLRLEYDNNDDDDDKNINGVAAPTSPLLPPRQLLIGVAPRSC